MAEVILICGKLCCGKTTYSKQLAQKMQGVRLSCDDIMLSLFGKDLGDRHDEVAERTQNYLLQKSLEIYHNGVSVIVDFGFWQKAKRDKVTRFYQKQGIQPKWHYIDIDEVTWHRNIEKRNEAVLKGETLDYYVDEGLADKCGKLFERPETDEMDVWHKNEWKE